MSLIYFQETLRFSGIVMITYKIDCFLTESSSIYSKVSWFNSADLDRENRKNLVSGDMPDPEEDWDQFYREFSAFIRAKVHRRRGRALEDEDAFQEAWLALITRIHHRPRGERGEFLRWITVVLRNRLANVERDAARRFSAPLPDDDCERLVAWEDSPSEVYERRRVQASVRRALEETRATLTENSYRVLVLKWLERLTVSEIAESLGITPAQVRDRHRRALPVLRSTLVRNLEADGELLELSS